EIAPYLPNPHKKRLYSVFAIQEMIDKIRNREYEYDALSVELDERERMNGLLKLLLSKLQIPGLKQVTDMMNNISNIQRIISMMGGMDAFKNGGLTGLLQNSPSQAPPQKRNPPEPYDEPVVEAASFKGGKTVDGLLTKQQKNSLARMLNSAKC
ncbi:MAG TPA: hypothetical protein PLZ84_02795, partial [Clostridia bacterium]|nr:hypothetical protein [Clostridia bacterium]